MFMFASKILHVSSITKEFSRYIYNLLNLLYFHNKFENFDVLAEKFVLQEIP